MALHRSPFQKLIITSLAAVVLAMILAAAPAPASAATAGFTNSTPITIPDEGTATPYTSQINVQGLSGRITDIGVTLSQFSHSRPQDVDVLLEAPDRQTSFVMADSCGNAPLQSAGWIFTSSATSEMSSDCSGLFYRPTNGYDVGSVDDFPNAPPFPWPTNFDHFMGASPNGTWKLYVVDNNGYGTTSGAIKGGWSLSISTEPADVVLPGNPSVDGTASPYPATRTVSGLDGVVKDIDVSLHGVYHELADDLNLLLVGPAGQNVMLMSDACGYNLVKGANWRWDDEAPLSMSDQPCTADTAYQPTGSDPNRQLPAPAPAGPYGGSLSAFDGGDPNGEWRLYAFDLRPTGFDGFFVERFQLQIETGPPAPIDRPDPSPDPSPDPGADPGRAPDADTSAPETLIKRAPKGATKRRTAKVRFTSSETGSTFECKFDRRRFRPCSSPRVVKRLRSGPHRFAVRAIDPAGNVDPTPAARRWRVR